MNGRGILLVEDSDDVELTLRAFARSRFAAPITVARDGAEALDILLGPPSARPVLAGAERDRMLSGQR